MDQFDGQTAARVYLGKVVDEVRLGGGGVAGQDGGERGRRRRGPFPD
ncbi:hypothetical protein [Streptomyces sp. TLI_185]|nr:hypothetical protein [Streptomyces sp. TLI_185]